MPFRALRRLHGAGRAGHHRQTLLIKCAGLTGDQLKLRTAEPSSLSLLGLVRHMAEVVRSWFRRRFAGEQVGTLYFSETNPYADFDDLDTANAKADLRTFTTERSSLRSRRRPATHSTKPWSIHTCKSR